MMLRSGSTASHERMGGEAVGLSPFLSHRKKGITMTNIIEMIAYLGIMALFCIIGRATIRTARRR
jgi:hypothetical protein